MVESENKRAPQADLVGRYFLDSPCVGIGFDEPFPGVFQGFRRYTLQPQNQSDTPAVSHRGQHAGGVGHRLLGDLDVRTLGLRQARVERLYLLLQLLLLSLLSPEAGTAWNLLTSAVRNPAVMQEGLRIVLADTAPASAAAPPEYGFRIKRTLSEAEDEARRAGNEQVDTGHMLLGLLDEGGPAGQMLRRSDEQLRA